MLFVTHFMYHMNYFTIQEVNILPYFTMSFFFGPSADTLWCTTNQMQPLCCSY